MRLILLNCLIDVSEYFEKAFEMSKLVLAGLVTISCYILFPTEAYVPPVIALGCTAILDIITKYYALSVQSGGFRRALTTKTISSRQLWAGTQRKLISYLVILVLCGLSIRVTPLATIAVFLSTSAYSIMFLREAQSCIENLVDAGNTDLLWVLKLIRRKRTDITEEVNNKFSESDNNNNNKKEQ